MPTSSRLLSTPKTLLLHNRSFPSVFMDKQVRKTNRLSNYDYSKNGAYFLTICVKDKQCLLSKISTPPVGDDAYIVPFAHIVPTVELTHYGLVAKKNLESIPGIDKYIIMPNHIHLMLVKNGAMKASHPTSISDDIRSFKTLFTKEVGHSIWQRSHLRYIEENPTKWILGKDKYYT